MLFTRILLLTLTAIVVQVSANTESFLLSIPSYVSDQWINISSASRSLLGNLNDTIEPYQRLLLTLKSSHLYNTEFAFALKNQLQEQHGQAQLQDDNDVVSSILFNKKEEYESKLVRLVNVNPGESYNIRLCWPATYPVSIGIEPKFFKSNAFEKVLTQTEEDGQLETRINEIVGEAYQVYVHIKYYSQFYSSEDDIMLRDMHVPIHLHAVGLRYNVIPKDIEPTIAVILSTLLVGVPISGIIYKFIQTTN